MNAATRRRELELLALSEPPGPETITSLERKRADLSRRFGSDAGRVRMIELQRRMLARGGTLMSIPFAHGFRAR